MDNDSDDFKLFGFAKDSNHNACLNWCSAPDAFILYAGGYKKAANELVIYVMKTKTDLDRMIYPIVFLYRHSVEIYLKMLIQNSYVILGINKLHPTVHSLADLWNELRRRLVDLNYDIPKDEIDFVSKCISEFTEYDKTSMSFRYSIGKNGESIVPSLTHINVRQLKDGMEKLLKILEILLYVTWKDLDTKSEMESA